MKPYLWMILFFIDLQGHGQSVSTLLGARSAGMGYASVVLQDESSLFNNIGAIAEVDKTSSFFAFEARPALPGSNRTGAGILAPCRAGVFAIGLFRFGDDLYHEQMVRCAYGNKLGIASLGGSLQYVQYSAGTFGRKGAFTVDFGGRAQITPQVSVGAYIVNVSQSRLSEQETLPVKLVAGIGFRPDERFLVITEVVKDLSYAATWKTGVEYVIHKKVFVRSGFNLNPNAAFFGLGAKTTRLKADYSIALNTMLGDAHQVSASFQFEHNKKK